MVTEQHGRLKFRTEFLPQSGQTYLHLPGIRPDRGACPACGAAENLYCTSDCDLTDPYAYDTVTRLRRCLLCDLLDRAGRKQSAHHMTMVLGHRSIRHLIEKGTERSLCHVTSVERGGIVFPGVPW